MPSNAPEVDKRELYGVFQAAEDWRQRLARKVAHKSLDIADDDMNIHVDNRRGLTAGGLLAAAALFASGGGVAAGAWALLQRPQGDDKPPAATQPAPPSFDDYSLEFAPQE